MHRIINPKDYDKSNNHLTYNKTNYYYIQRNQKDPFKSNQ